MAIIKKFRIKNFKQEKELLRLEKISVYFGKRKILEDLNLNCIKTLKEIYNLPIGYSGHEASLSPSVMAATLGAAAIERHITLDRAMYGSDQAASLQPEGFRQLTQILRNMPNILGDGEKRILKEEELIASKLRYWLEK